MPKAIITATANRSRTSRLTRAHAELVQALAALPPPPHIAGSAAAADVKGRAKHGKQVYEAVVRYLDSVAGDTAAHLAASQNADWPGIDLALWDSYDDPEWNAAAALERAGVRFEGIQAAAA